MESKIMFISNKVRFIEEVISNDVYNLCSQFFEAIVAKLNEVLDADYTFIGKLSEDRKQVATLSLVDKAGVLDNFIYDLSYTPCENVIGQNACSYPKNVADLFPDDQLLIDMEIEGYVGIPLYDSKKAPTGILVCLFKNEVVDTFAVESVLMLFATRISAELEHLKLYDVLKRHKEELEDKVQNRTVELNEKNLELETTNLKLAHSLKELQNTQSQLIQSEKMASLGILTSGVAHEINNPLNYLMGASVGLSSYFDTHKSQDKATTDILLEAVNTGIERISNIVKGLNQFSRNNESMDEDCNLETILNNCLAMLSHKITDNVNIVNHYSGKKVIVKGNSGKIHQVLLNILSNSIYALKGSGEIQVTTHSSDNDAFIEIADNGVGIEASLLQKVCDPFFTTKAPGEGTGLGLSISTSIINEHKGKIEIDSEFKKGTKVMITLPLKQDIK
jgi:C4-dicarboxylate-specific signal transduction histidine kinase